MLLRFVIVLLMFFCLFPKTMYAATPLPLAQAFQLQANISEHKTILLHWTVAPHYYLYAEKFQFTSVPYTRVIASIPQGEFKYVAEKERQEVLTGRFVIPLSFEKVMPLTLTVHYQGCSHDGFCYPPSQKNYRVDLNNNTIDDVPTKANSDWLPALFDQEKIKQLLKTQQQGIVLAIFFVFGLLLAFTPCVLPMLPILSSIIMGNNGKRHSMQALLLSFFYVLGAACAYALIGLLAASIGQSLQVMLQKSVVLVIVSFLFLLLAAINFGWLSLIFPKLWQKAILAVNHRINGGSYIGVFFMGVVSTLIVSPCITAPLVGVLLYIAETSNKILGASALFSMGMGLGLPLFIAGTSLNYLLPSSGNWLIAVKHSFGFVMLAMAIWLLSRVLSPVIIYGISGVFILILSSYIAFLLPRYLKYNRSCLLLGVVVGMIGFYVMADSAPHWLTKKVEKEGQQMSFQRVQSMAALDVFLLRAKKEKIPVIIDFYADWCTSCIIMEKEVLSSPQVLPHLKLFRLLRVDLTQNTADDQAIMRRFNVIAPPTFLLFDDHGTELLEKRIVGEVTIPFFLDRLNAATSSPATRK